MNNRRNELQQHQNIQNFDAFERFMLERVPAMKGIEGSNISADGHCQKLALVYRRSLSRKTQKFICP